MKSSLAKGTIKYMGSGQIQPSKHNLESNNLDGVTTPTKTCGTFLNNHDIIKVEKETAEI